ncbi:hypothetical protein E2C01_067789 [Portunus trituberculatus]|uniref:Uncharacterized protein n=1 Tax=Portunus trituberculatus TaxID=210409 RepID=A0A5B7HLZ5_PORTR|nr:hypothetical protein [Portunus trituberculatus]
MTATRAGKNSNPPHSTRDKGIEKENKEEWIEAEVRKGPGSSVREGRRRDTRCLPYLAKLCGVSC